MKYNVAICVPTGFRPSLETWTSIDNLIKPRPGGQLEGTTSKHHVHGLETATARKLLTQMALRDPDVTHLLWIDDDMAFPADALARLLAHDKDIVGGLCHNRRGPSYHPIVAREYPEELGLPESALGFVYDLPSEGLIECDATGAAFLLVKADVFRKLAQHAASLPEWSGPAWADWWQPFAGLSEDFSFCRRAQEAGYRIFVDAGLDIGHVAEVVITKETSSRLRTAEWAKWQPLAINKPVEGKLVATIVIPTYNQKPAYLKAAVLSALNQTLPVEVIVVDDGTTDYNLRCGEMTTEMLEDADAAGKKNVWISSRAKLIRHDTNRGISAALNTGIGFMSTDWFCWLSSDDILTPNKVEVQLNAMLASGAKASFHDYASTGSNGGFPTYVRGQCWSSLPEQKRVLAQTCAINGSTVMLHASVFEAFPENSKLGRFFDPELRYAQDWDAWNKIGQRFLWHYISQCLGTRREGENLTAKIAASAENDPARIRRDEEDRIVRERYNPSAKMFAGIRAALTVAAHPWDDEKQANGLSEAHRLLDELEKIL